MTHIITTCEYYYNDSNYKQNNEYNCDYEYTHEDEYDNSEYKQIYDNYNVLNYEDENDDYEYKQMYDNYNVSNYEAEDNDLNYKYNSYNYDILSHKMYEFVTYEDNWDKETEEFNQLYPDFSQLQDMDDNENILE